MTFRSICIGFALSMLLCLGSTQLMAAISLDFVPVDNSAVLAGYKTYDVLVTTDADWTSAAMLFELSGGSLYQHAQGQDSVADPAVIPTFYPQHPEVAFDTYVIGSVAGGGGDIGMRRTQLAFDTQRLDVSWYNLTPDQVGTTNVARLTLTDDTAGLLKLMFTINAGYREPSWARFDVEFVPGAGPVITQEVHEVFKPLETSTATPSPGARKYPDGTKTFPFGLPTDGVRESRNYIFLDGHAPIPTGQDLIWQNPYFNFSERSYLTIVGLDPTPIVSTRGYPTWIGFGGILEPATIAYSSPLATLPEPATLILMAGGLGTVGLRQRSSPVVV